MLVAKNPSSQDYLIDLSDALMNLGKNEEAETYINICAKES